MGELCLLNTFKKLQSIRNSKAGTRAQFDMMISLLFSFAGNPGKNLLTLAKNLTVLQVDFVTWLLFWQKGLKKYQRLYVSPTQISFGYQNPPPHHFGVIRYRHWDYELVPVMHALGGVPQRCRQRIRDQLSWEETGEIRSLVAKKVGGGKIPPELENRIRQRYELLDGIIKELSQTHYLRSSNHFEKFSFREKGGIGVIINRDGSLSLCDGHHRFGIAHALNLETIPVALYAVHPEYVKSGEWKIFFSKHLDRPRTSENLAE